MHLLSEHSILLFYDGIVYDMYLIRLSPVEILVHLFKLYHLYASPLYAVIALFANIFRE